MNNPHMAVRTPKRGARRYHEPQVCPECGRVMATLVPWHGDGSLALIVTHGPRSNRCPGSRAVPHDGYRLVSEVGYMPSY